MNFTQRTEYLEVALSPHLSGLPLSQFFKRLLLRDDILRLPANIQNNLWEAYYSLCVANTKCDITWAIEGITEEYASAISIRLYFDRQVFNAEKLQERLMEKLYNQIKDKITASSNFKRCRENPLSPHPLVTDFTV